MNSNKASSNQNSATSEPLFEFEDDHQRNLFYSIIWLIMVLLLVFPLATFLCPFWVVLQIVEAFVPVVREVNELLEKLLTWPRKMGLAIRNGRESFPNPFETETSPEQR